ncbi:MAG: hypothetical protein SynsKO_22770 [Synoicihabitans sp.]
MPAELPSILIPVHNRRVTTVDCLRHLACESPRLLEQVVLLDDGCTDGTVEAVRSEFPTVKIESGCGDWWWTGAINHGMQLVDKTDAVAVLWLNDDCRPSPKTIERLTRRATQGDGSIVSAICRTADGRIIETGFKGRQKIKPALLKVTPVDGLSGFCVAIGRGVWQRIGFPDSTRFPHYAGDTSYTLDASRQGFSVAIDGNSSAEVKDIQQGGESWIRRVPTGAGLARRWKEAFWNKGSSWRLSTDWHLSWLKFGGVMGSLVWASHAMERHVTFLTRAAKQAQINEAKTPPASARSSGAWIVIPAHNRRDTTLACLRTLGSLPESRSLKVVVVDDGSSDGTGEAIAREFPETTIIAGTGDLWWTGATEIGMRHAYGEGAEFIVWLNDDCLPEPGALEQLINTSRKRKAIVGGRIVAPTGPETIYGGFAEQNSQIHRLGTPEAALMSCAALNGNMVCFPRNVISMIGWPDSRGCPHAYGDVDYTLRAHRRGIPVLLDKNARAVGMPNLSQDYARWLRDEVSLGPIWRAIPRKGSHLYPPAVWNFHTRAWGWRGIIQVFEIYGRLTAITLFRVLTPRSWQKKLIARLPRRQ